MGQHHVAVLGESRERDADQRECSVRLAFFLRRDVPEKSLPAAGRGGARGRWSQLGSLHHLPAGIVAQLSQVS